MTDFNQHVKDHRLAELRAKSKIEIANLNARHQLIMQQLNLNIGGAGYAILMLWAEDELRKGNRVKASKIFRVAERLKWRYNAWRERERRLMYGRF